MTTQVAEPASSALETPAAPSSSSDGRRAAGAPSSTRSARSARLAWLGLGTVMAVAVLVFWAFDALPFQDLPAHAGLIAMRHRFASSPFEARFFVLAPHIGPYSLFRFLGEGFVRVVGPVGAVRALGTLPLVATPLAMLFGRRRLFGDHSTSHGFLGVALSFGLMTLLGFASYLLGVAVMVVALVLWLDLLCAVDDDAPEAKRKELVIAFAAPLVFVAHGHAFVLFLICAGVSCIAAGRRGARMLRLRALAPAIALAAWVAWVERGSTTPPGSVHVTAPLVPLFQDATDKLGLLVSATLMTRTGIDFIAAIAIWIFTAACTVATLRSAADPKTRASKNSRALYLSALVISLLFVALPHAVGWFGFVDGRLVPVILILALLAIRRPALPPALTRLLDVGAPLTASAITILALVASYRFQGEAAGFKEVLAKVPAEARLLNLPLDPNSDVFTAHPFVHYDKLVLAERPIVVSDVWFHQGSALYPTPENPALRLPDSYSESDLKRIDWPAYHLEDWDYVLIRTRPNASQPHTPLGVNLEEHRGGWWLFRHTQGT